MFDSITLYSNPYFISLFQLVSSVNLLFCQMCTFYCPLRKKWCTLLPEEIDVHIWNHIHQEDWTLYLSLYQYALVIHKKQNYKSIFIRHDKYKVGNKNKNKLKSAKFLVKMMILTCFCFYSLLYETIRQTCLAMALLV